MLEQIRRWRPTRPVPLTTILWPLRRGFGDPAFRVVAGNVWRTARTPAGPVTLQVSADAATGEVTGRAWGPGTGWALETLPAMLGDTDDAADEFAAVHAGRHPFLRRAHRMHPHWRVPRSGLVHEALLAAVLEQKVTGQEAWAGWRRLLRRFGDPAPGPGEDMGLRVLPAPEVVCRIPSWEWLRMPVDPARSRAAIAASKVASSLERTLSLPGQDAERALCSVPGVGVWTAAEVRQRAHGDADAVSFGDYHVPGMIGHTLTGTTTTDAEVADLLEPFRPHRYRIQRLVELCGTRPPRHGPRMAPRRHLPGGYR